MAKKLKKKKGSSKKKSGNWVPKVLIIIFVLIFAFFMVARFMKRGNDVKPTQAGIITPAPENITVNGVWTNNNDESTLSIKDGKYSIYMTGLDMNHPFIGKYTISGNVITFVSTQDPCEGAKGSYKVSFTGQDIVLQCVEDDCSKRKAILKNDWIWLDTSYDD